MTAGLNPGKGPAGEGLWVGKYAVEAGGAGGGGGGGGGALCELYWEKGAGPV